MWLATLSSTDEININYENNLLTKIRKTKHYPFNLASSQWLELHVSELSLLACISSIN